MSEGSSPSGRDTFEATMLRMKRVKRETEVDIVDGVICNFCGQEIQEGWRDPDGSFDAECVTVDKTWGYFSKKDMTQQRAHICESCWDGLCGQMKVPVLEHDLMEPCPGFDEDYEAYADEEADCTADEHQPYCRHWKGDSKTEE